MYKENRCGLARARAWGSKGAMHLTRVSEEN